MTADPWEGLVVWDRLAVGPVRLGPRRLDMPYVIEAADGTVAERVHAFSWAEDVFDPEDWQSRNLASLVGAQVALNYGLFAKEIVFRGPFDRIDRALLTSMAENTAREIAVKKLLEPNAFLRPPAVGLPATPRERWCRADLLFPDVRVGEDGEPWGREDQCIAVLSSGGKESLLTQGLFEELGFEVHALFGNESGRHWLTALNAFRWLSDHRPGTAKVWMDSDRMFAWFLRHLPFVRQDFATVRADDYPIRLWTVAVFLFAVLPLLRKRGIDRIAIGDEYDTTRRVEHEGIAHYDGLFDQSRFFDETMTGFLFAKGWDVTVFSALRSQSELLVQHRLAARYPELFAQQVSCHAAHTDGQRVRPCGRCEKCRRIVGMLVATGHDPADCGYTAAQVDACIAALTRPGSHSEVDVLQDVLWRLVERGAIPADGSEAAQARHVPEIGFLRFDDTCAPVDHVPAPLRAPLYRLLLEDAQGAVIRHDDDWEPFDVLADPQVAG